ncbi:MAG: hypothetical protein QOC81_705 [Thermoanaerobaculia bacterium]|nr:hypothetical protein [Thermoanaerobaculia bacterium]
MGDLGDLLVAKAIYSKQAFSLTILDTASVHRQQQQRQDEECNPDR